MDHTDIMRAIRDICNDDCSGCYLIEIGDVLEILTTDLLDLLLDEANRGLSKHGWVTLEHLSKSFDLPIKVRLKCLSHAGNALWTASLKMFRGSRSMPVISLAVGYGWYEHFRCITMGSKQSTEIELNSSTAFPS